MKEISAADFNEKVKNSTKLVVIDFWAEWCGPCKMLMPVLKEVAEANKNIHFFKMNTDTCGDIAGQFRVMSIPCLVFMNKGEEKGRLVGFNTKEKIQAWLEQCSK